VRDDGSFFYPRVALASLSGSSDAEWANRRRQWIGAAFLGAFNLDAETTASAWRMAARGRNEFLPREPLAFIEEQLSRCESTGFRPGINLRACDPRAIQAGAALAERHGALVEINAHCRQPEMVEIGCGEALLRDPPRLMELVAAAAETGVTVSVKGRFGVTGADPVAVLNESVTSGAKILHVDTMDSRPLLRELRAPFVIANNGVRTLADVAAFAGCGAHAVSVGRDAHPETLEQVLLATALLDRRGSRTPVPRPDSAAT